MFSVERMQHFITTPFYVKRHFKGQRELQLADPEWLNDRLQLFADYCLPSVVGQTDQNFEWFLYFDESTPARYLEQVNSLISRHRNIAVKLCETFGSAEVARDIVASQSKETSWIVTTRLDNDDGLHRDFVSTLHAFVEEREEFLNFPRGIILYSGKCFLYEHPSNAFISFVEPADKRRTAWAVAHPYAADVAPVRQLPDIPAFLQVIHGKNVSNKPRGTRVDVRRALMGFETIAALGRLSKGETQLGIIFDNATTVVLWRLRDLLLSLVRRFRR